MAKTANTPPLIVYKASAGSGKTFTLAVEYIKLLIKNPHNYRNILAVTFTNKATEEMKMRILSQLNGLANGYEDSNDYLKKITKELHCDETLVKTNARLALHGLIHDYSSFKVETIDKFFQRILKNLARELDLTPNLRIELNDKQVESYAVDGMIESLGNEDQLLKWLMSYIVDKINDDKSWNIIGQVKKFGENIFKDTYKQNREQLQAIMSDPTFFHNYKKKLSAIRRDNIDKMKEHANRFFEATKGYSAEDFNYGMKGIYGYFSKLREGDFDGSETKSRVKDCMESSEKWVKKTHPARQAIVSMAENKLKAILHETESDRVKCFSQILSADLTLKHLDQLRLLGNIEKTVREMNNAANRFLLSDTQGMLHAMIEDNDTPFIFEKIGAPLNHIMIDEFQDTGNLQWQNFKVLLSNCMDQHHGNLIVGDVKQSIYRWRSGDWRLLNGITHEFNDDDQKIEVKPLDTNYRSSKRVVEFNNEFFVTAAALEHQRLQLIVGKEAEQLKKAYEDVVQQLPENKEDGGYVRLELMEQEQYEEHILEKISETIHQLLDAGISQRNIAILARRNEDIEDTAYYFQTHEPDINIVSDEAFHINTSITVKVLINALRVLSNDKDILSKAYLAKSYTNDILGKDIPDAVLLLSCNPKETQLAFREWLPEGFRDAEDYAQLRSKPLTDLVESLYEMFELGKLQGQSPYLCTFYDTVLEYLKDNTSDIDRFLNAWDESLYKKAIHGDNVDGIRIVSIHKSKGLEYDNVILPFCDWKLEKSDTLWCKMTDAPEPYNELPILPIDYSKNKMMGSIYEKDYCMEHLQNTVDNLNLLYVAFTRAQTRLFVYGANKPNTHYQQGTNPLSRSELITECIKKMKEDAPLLTYPCDITEDEGAVILEYGTCFPSTSRQEKEKKETANILLKPDESIPFEMKSYPMRVTFRQSNDSKEFTQGEPSVQTNYITRGNLLHSIFSRLKDLSDIERVLQDLTHAGILYDETSPDELRNLLQQALENPKVREWFSPHWTLHNECSILYFDEKGAMKSRRPDRVMSDGQRTIVVDFKFGKPNSDYVNQVKRYVKLLRDMGHAHVEGYLWYVDRNEITPCNK